APPASPEGVMSNRAPQGAIVAIDQLTCGYDGRPVLREVSLNLQPGQFAGVVGPSGCGKTTLIRSILGAVDRYGGRVAVAGQDVRRGGRLKCVYVPQLETMAWSFPVPVGRVVLMGLAGQASPLPWTSRGERKRMFELLERLGLAGTERRHIRDLSGGQQ